MKGSFSNFWILFILNFFIFICCFIHTVYGVNPSDTCVSNTPIQENLFDESGYNTAAYPQNCYLEMGRILHRAFGLKYPTKYCAKLYGVNLTIKRLLLTGFYAIKSEIIDLIRQIKKKFARSSIKEDEGIFINGERQSEPPPNTKTLLNSYEEYLMSSLNEFKKIGIMDVPEQDSLYVSRNEIAFTIAEDENVNIIGSDGATRCLIILLIHQITKVVGLTQVCDVPSSEKAVDLLLEKVTAHPAKHILSLYLIGSYHSHVEDVFLNIMEKFHKIKEEIHLMLLCAGVFNGFTMYTNPRPEISGIGVKLDDLSIFPAFFGLNYGPEWPLRQGRIIAGNLEISCIYDSSVLPHLIIDQFDYNFNDTNKLMAESYDALMKRFYGMEGIIQGLMYLEANPTSDYAFPEKKPRYYQRDNHIWVQITPN